MCGLLLRLSDDLLRSILEASDVSGLTTLVCTCTRLHGLRNVSLPDFSNYGSSYSDARGSLSFLLARNYLKQMQWELKSNSYDGFKIHCILGEVVELAESIWNAKSMATFRILREKALEYVEKGGTLALGARLGHYITAEDIVLKFARGITTDQVHATHNDYPNMKLTNVRVALQRERSIPCHLANHRDTMTISQFLPELAVPVVAQINLNQVFEVSLHITTSSPRCHSVRRLPTITFNTVLDAELCNQMAAFVRPPIIPDSDLTNIVRAQLESLVTLYDLAPGGSAYNVVKAHVVTL